MVRLAADITVGITGRRATLAAFVLGADVPALVREGTLEALGGQLDVACVVWALRNRGVGTPLGVNPMGHFVLSVVALGDRPKLAGSHFGWALCE